MDRQALVVLIILLLIVVAVFFRLFLWPGLRQRRIRNRPFPQPWRAILHQCLPFVANMPPGQQQKLESHIKLFLADKKFYGCAGQQISDEIRVSVAAQACLLVLSKTDVPYPELQAILVYPSTFVATREVADEHGLVATDHIALLGESWSHGKVILAWDNVQHGAMNLQDGQNVVLHEFAHQLDHESGAINGAPVLLTRGAYKSWAHVFTEEFEDLQEDEAAGRHSLMDHYGATDPAEFFAVATETFFERPREMALHHRELYLQLKQYYELDPGDWSGGP
ncbi:MAG: zinc-dependent peptidase [Gammaproteobacteria bacterium]